MHENRETSLASAPADRSGKANSRKPDAYAREESDCAVVSVKRPNKEAIASAEVVEKRVQTKENDAGPSTSPTQSGVRVSQGLGGVRQAARARKQERFTALAASSERRTATGKLLRAEAERGSRGGRREMARV
jgi:ribonucleotide reductase alpha subunit